jgi:hypothetical protein
MIRGRKVACTGHISVIPKGRVERPQRRASSHVRPGPSRHLSPPKRVPLPLREPLHFIVMSVISGTFPDTNGVFYMTVDCRCIRGPSRHRHGERHRRNALPKRLTRRRDGDDANDDELRMRSRQGMRLYFVGPYPFNLTRRTRRTEQKTPFLCDFRV